MSKYGRPSSHHFRAERSTNSFWANYGYSFSYYREQFLHSKQILTDITLLRNPVFPYESSSVLPFFISGCSLLFIVFFPQVFNNLPYYILPFFHSLIHLQWTNPPVHDTERCCYATIFTITINKPLVQFRLISMDRSMSDTCRGFYLCFFSDSWKRRKVLCPITPLGSQVFILLNYLTAEYDS